MGSNPRTCATWRPIIERLRKKLSTWKRRLLSIGGKVKLLNSILSRILIYFMSFFKAPKKMIQEITQYKVDFYGMERKTRNESLGLSRIIFVNKKRKMDLESGTYKLSTFLY